MSADVAPASRARCSYMTRPALDLPCVAYATWAVFYRVGIGRLLVAEPFLRCGDHLAETVGILARNDHATGSLDRVERLPYVDVRA